jgi:hypothetical protein
MQAASRQRHGKHASTTIQLLLETMFCTQSVQRGYKKDNWSRRRQGSLKYETVKYGRET